MGIAKKIIFIPVFSPIIIRNFFLIPGSVFDILNKKGVKIVMFVPQQLYERAKKDFEKEKNVIVEPVKINWKMNFPQKIYNFTATYLNFTEGARLFAKLGIRIDRPVAGGKNYLYPLKVLISKTLGKSKWFRIKLMPEIDNLVYKKRPYKGLFEKYKPDLVFIPDALGFQDIAVLREAKRQKIRTMGMPASWDHLPKKYEPLKVDKLMVWNEVLKKEATELQNYNDENIFITGVPQYDIFARPEFLKSRDEFFNKFNLDKNKKLIFLAGGSIYAPDDGDVADMIVNFIKDDKLASECQFFIRPYPGVKYDYEKFKKFDSENFVYIDRIETEKLYGNAAHAWYPSVDSFIYFVNILYHSDIIISTYSSVSVEASAFLKPIININFDGYKNRPFNQSVKRFKHLSHYKHVLETEGVRQTENRDDLLEALDEFLKNPDANKENVIKLRNKMCWKIDSRASERIANHLLKCLE